MGRQESSGGSTCLAISSPESVRKFFSVVSRSDYRSSNIGRHSRMASCVVLVVFYRPDIHPSARRLSVYYMPSTVGLIRQYARLLRRIHSVVPGANSASVDRALSVIYPRSCHIKRAVCTALRQEKNIAIMAKKLIVVLGITGAQVSKQTLPGVC